METLVGHLALTVAFRDGKTEEVRVRQLGVEQYPTLFGALFLRENEQEALELYCDKPRGWAARLTHEAHEKLVAEADRLNADFFGPWCRRRMARQQLVVPDLLERVTASVSQTMSLNAPSNAGSR